MILMKTGSFDIKPQSILSKFNISEGHESHDQIVVRFILPLLNAISIFTNRVGVYWIGTTFM